MSSKKAKKPEQGQNFATRTFYVDDDKTLVLVDDAQIITKSDKVKKGFVRATTVSVEKPGKPLIPVLCCAIAQDAALNPHVMVRGGHLVVIIDDSSKNLERAGKEIANKLDMKNLPMAITLGIIEKSFDGNSWVDVGLFTCIPSLMLAAETPLYNLNYLVSWCTRDSQQTKGIEAHKELLDRVFKPLVDRMAQSKILKDKLITEFSEWAAPTDDHPWRSNSWGESPLKNYWTVGRHMLWISQIWKHHKRDVFDDAIKDNIKFVYGQFKATVGITDLSATIFMAFVMLYDTAMAQSSRDIPLKSTPASDSMSSHQLLFDILFVRKNVNSHEKETKKFYTELHSASPEELKRLLSATAFHPPAPMAELSNTRVNRFESVTLETAHRVMTRVSDERNALHMASHQELLGLTEMSQAQKKKSRSRSRSKSRGRSRSRSKSKSRSRSAKPKTSKSKSRSRSRSRSSKSKGGASKSKSRSRSRSAKSKGGASKSKSRSRSRSAKSKGGASKSKSRSRSRSATSKGKTRSRSSSAKPKGKSRSQSPSAKPKEKKSSRSKSKSKSRSRSSSSSKKKKEPAKKKTQSRSSSKSKSRSRSTSRSSKKSDGRTRSKSTSSTDKKPEEGKKSRSRSRSESRGRSKTRSRRNSDKKSRSSSKKSSRSTSSSPATTDKKANKSKSRSRSNSKETKNKKKKDKESKSKSDKESDKDTSKRGRSKSRSKSRGRKNRNGEDGSSERQSSPSRQTNINLRFGGGRKTVTTGPTSTPVFVPNPDPVASQPAQFRDDFFYQQRLADLEERNARLESRQRDLDLQLQKSQVENERKEIERQQALLDKDRSALAAQRDNLDLYMKDIAEKQQLQKQQQQQQQATGKPPDAATPSSPGGAGVPSPQGDASKPVVQQTTFSSHAVAEALSRFFAY